MTGPEHYRQAEQLAEQAEHWFGSYEDHRQDFYREAASWCLTKAHLPATLAVAAAFGLQNTTRWPTDWENACAPGECA